MPCPTPDTVAARGKSLSPRTRVRRIAERANCNRDTLYTILDAAYVYHVAFADEHGVHCIPTACCHEGDHHYVHGFNGSRMQPLASEGAQVCVTITHLDGFVLARSAFHHSMNYRSAMIYGAFNVVGADRKAAALDAFLNHVTPDRGREVRAGDRDELEPTAWRTIRKALELTNCGDNIEAAFVLARAILRRHGVHRFMEDAVAVGSIECLATYWA